MTNINISLISSTLPRPIISLLLLVASGPILCQCLQISLGLITTHAVNQNHHGITGFYKGLGVLGKAPEIDK